MAKRNAKGQFEPAKTQAELKRAMYERYVSNELRRLWPSMDAPDAAFEAKRLVDHAYAANYIEKRPVMEVVAAILRVQREAAEKAQKG